jgi:dipeptidyl aminopeptidase/acylaminoacyl peptidase
MKTLRITSILSFFVQIAFAQNWSPEQCIKMKNIASIDVSSDGKKVVYTVREALMNDESSEYIQQIYIANSDGSDAIKLTKGTKNNTNPKFSPDSKKIAFTSNRDGKTNLYVLSLAGGEAEKMTEAKSGVGSFAWSPNGETIAYLMSDAPTDAEEKDKKGKNDWYYMDENQKYSRIYTVSLSQLDDKQKPKTTQITKDNRNVNDFSWSPDGKRIAYSHSITSKVGDAAYSDISVVDLSNGNVSAIANSPANEASPKFSFDGNFIAFMSSENPNSWSGRDFVKVYSFTDSKTTELNATPDDQIGLLGWSEDSKMVYVSEANKTLNAVYALSLDKKPNIEITKGQTDFLAGFALNQNASYLSFILQNPTKLGEGYISKTSQFSPQKITNIQAEHANKPLPKTELVKWKGANGQEIEGLLTYPINYQDGQKYPLILNIHGGPAGVFAQNCTASNSGSYPLAAFAERGYFILRPNPRGSSGYGVKFRQANERDWGGADYQDLMLGVDYALSKGNIDANRLGVMGWSYGGFMSSWIIGHTDRFKVASIGAPVVDLVAQNLTDDIAGFLPSYMRAEPWQDTAIYEKLSPINYIGNAKTPSMIQHCEGDIRVPIHGGIMIYNALKRKGVPTRMLALPRQGHGPVEPKMVLKISQSNIEWMDKFLMPKPNQP